MRNAASGRRFPREKMSRKRVSSPMQTNAMLKSVLLNPLVILPAARAVSASRQKLKISDASTKPTTNFGKRLQITPSVGFSRRSCPLQDQ